MAEPAHGTRADSSAATGRPPARQKKKKRKKKSKQRQRQRQDAARRKWRQRRHARRPTHNWLTRNAFFVSVSVAALVTLFVFNGLWYIGKRRESNYLRGGRPQDEVFQRVRDDEVFKGKQGLFWPWLMGLLGFNRDYGAMIWRPRVRVRPCDSLRFRIQISRPP